MHEFSHLNYSGNPSKWILKQITKLQVIVICRLVPSSASLKEAHQEKSWNQILQINPSFICVPQLVVLGKRRSPCQRNNSFQIEFDPELRHHPADSHPLELGGGAAEGGYEGSTSKVSCHGRLTLSWHRFHSVPGQFRAHF